MTRRSKELQPNKSWPSKPSFISEYNRGIYSKTLRWVFPTQRTLIEDEIASRDSLEPFQLDVVAAVDSDSQSDLQDDDEFVSDDEESSGTEDSGDEEYKPRRARKN